MVSKRLGIGGWGDRRGEGQGEGNSGSQIMVGGGKIDREREAGELRRYLFVCGFFSLYFRLLVLISHALVFISERARKEIMGGRSSLNAVVSWSSSAAYQI